ncbi:hypothetical protein Pmar_PMAR010697 [Perkinsus marinus ATCC 50983]|uniref:Uncharacterized protein n=1 Tax=Perkinsus marinus (strain ATCC 50983 / TXsc) TaxID=423536 RepID=C5KY96_PERM5|nr:hypothetical protein Pmar_PMAR010697 [Perkinsus marinus ATCC 50983]EER10548.1 hypothetical protein Pmar_PMAR010697 [Perkinsus marinus ATCC 50983]|eukprot:XP_002778753.1 hypothetical protein Pmar_PMAR010697 [Perkinsus marinus ATCC 50983]
MLRSLLFYWKLISKGLLCRAPETWETIEGHELDEVWICMRNTDMKIMVNGQGENPAEDNQNGPDGGLLKINMCEKMRSNGVYKKVKSNNVNMKEREEAYKKRTT